MRMRLLALWVLLLLSPRGASAHGDINTRVLLLESRAEADPGDIGALLDLANAYAEAGDLRSALHALDRAEARRPADLRVPLERARLHNAAGKHALAWDALAATEGRAWAELDAERAFTLGALGRVDEADLAWTRCTDVRADPEWVLAHARMLRAAGRSDAGVNVLARGLVASRGAIVVRMALVDALVQDRRWDEAAHVVEDVLPRLQVKAEWRLRLADIREQQGRHGEALQQRRQVVEELDVLLARRPSGLHRATRERAARQLAGVKP